MTSVTLSDRANLVAKKKEDDAVHSLCNVDHTQRFLAMQDAMDILGGKWRIQIIGALSYKGKMRFTEFMKAVDGIGAKMLSKELHDLETNQLLTRTVKQTKPITVEYEITEYGRTLSPLILEIVTWGMIHRERIMKGEPVAEPS